MTPTTGTTAAGGFASLGLIDELAAAVSALGYEEPTPVQRETIPLLLAKRDVLGQAATGTGKTAAFALPMLQRLAEDEAAKKQTGGLVLVPTRELDGRGGAPHAKARRLVLPATAARPSPSRSAPRARRRHRRRRRMRARSHQARHTETGNLRMLVLDEADEMLTWVSAEDLDAIPRRRRRRGKPLFFGDDAVADSVDRAASMDNPRVIARARRPPRKSRASARSPTSRRALGPRRSTACSTWRTRPRRSCSPDAAGSRDAARDAQRARRRAQAPRRHGTASARPCDADVPACRPAHRTDAAARGLTSNSCRMFNQTPPKVEAYVTASAAPAAPAARARRSRSPSRASTGCCAASKRSPNRRSTS